jgi:DNA mismatch repair ATPase MutS
MTGESEMSLALGSLNACVNQLKLMSHGVKDFEIEKYTLAQYLRLDVAALNALNVFPQNNEIVAGSAGSLFGLLNNCKT